MTNEERIERTNRLAARFRQVILEMCEGRTLDAGDDAALDVAGTAMAILTLHDTAMKSGLLLTDHGIQIYEYMARERDDALAHLDIEWCPKSLN